MGHSRITLATLLALGLLGTVQAEEGAREPFFVELKGPDGSPPPAVQPEPRAQPVAPVTLPRAQPIVRQVPAASAGSYGPVRPTDTLWSLASKHRPSNRVSVYQTMVAIYDKNPRSFADGNINHILVGSHILLPTAAEAGRITDAEARRRFNSDNASWKGLSPKYLANKQSHVAQPVVSKPAPAKPAVVAKNTPPKAAPIPAAPKATAPAPEVKETVKAAVSTPVVVSAAASSAASTAPAPLPATAVGKPSTEMALALEDANAQLGQVTEMNHRLKLRLQALTEEVETLKAQLQDQTALQKEVAELKANPTPPVVAPVPKQSWLMELLSSPLNLAMIILLPVLLVLALVTLWLRARARRELEEQEKSLSESTSMVMGDENSEFDQLMTVGIADDEPLHGMPDLNEPEVSRKQDGASAAADVIFRDDETALSAFDVEPAVTTANRDPDLVPELDLAHEGDFDLPVVPELDLSDEPTSSARGHDEIMTEEELQAALFAELDADLEADLAQAQEESRSQRDETLANFDLSDLETGFGEPTDDELAAKAPHIDETGFGKDDVDDMLAELGLEPTKPTASEWDPSELALADFEDAFAEVESHQGEVKPREQVQDSDFVEIDKLLADADASSTEQEPYQGFSLDVGLDGFPEVLPESNGFDVDADDGGVGAKLDLARAYLEIDDKESARELLEEAVAQGSEHQRSEAQKLLKRLG